jgi:hypothetical protein
MNHPVDCQCTSCRERDLQPRPKLADLPGAPKEKP